LGVVDFVLPPIRIAGQLAAMARAMAGGSTVMPEKPTIHAVPEGNDVETDPELATIFQLLRNNCGFDFTYYKHTTIRRRIRRRMMLQGFTSLPDYTAELARNQHEAN